MADTTTSVQVPIVLFMLDTFGGLTQVSAHEWRFNIPSGKAIDGLDVHRVYNSREDAANAFISAARGRLTAAA